MNDSKQSNSKKYDWNKHTDLIDKDIITRVNNDLDAIFARSQKNKAKWNRIAPLNIPAIIAAYEQYEKEKKSSMMRAIQNAIDKAFDLIDTVTKVPLIYSIITAPIGNRVEPGTYVLIFGGNFGEKPGHVDLSYTYSNHEYSHYDTMKEETIKETIPLDPYMNSWEKGWSSNLIIVKATTTYKKPWICADRTGELKVVLADGTSLTESITVGAGAPQILSLQTIAGIVGHNYKIRPDEEFVVKGRNFGKVQGKAKLFFRRGGTKTWLRQENGDIWLYDYPDSGNIKNYDIDFVGLSIQDWSNNYIVLKADNYSLKEYFGGGLGTLLIENNDTGREGIFDKIWFGPDLEVRMVSGFDWLDKDAQKAAKITPNGAAMDVTHTPSCGVIDSGEKGYDMFFGDTPWPTDVEVHGFYFKMFDPDDPYTDWDFFKQQTKELAEAASDGPVGIAEWVGNKALDAIVGGGTGGYHAYVSPSPGGYAWTFKGTRVISIRWESDCSLGGKPIRYLVYFYIAGTKQAVAKYGGVKLNEY